MKNRIDEILNHPKGTPRWKCARLRQLAQEAADRGFERLSHDYWEASMTAIKPETGEPYPIYKNRYTTLFYDNVPGRVIVAKEKYGDRFFMASTPQEITHACLCLIQERIELGYYSDSLSEEENPGDQMDLFKSNKVPMTDKQYAEKLLDLAREDTGFLYAGRNALMWLHRDRANREYEGLEFQTPENPTFD